MYVNTEEIMLLASTVESTNNSITSALENVTAKMKSLNDSWGGAAGQKVISLFNEMKSDTGCIGAQKISVTDYVNFLKQRVSYGYEEIEKANEKLSDAFK